MKQVVTAQILSNEAVAPGVFCMELLAPALCCARPGQFVQVKPAGAEVQILRMPFCVYDVNPQIGSIEVMYQVLGEGTTHLSTLRLGDAVSVVGPLGNGWNVPAGTKRALLVSGGLGAAPLNLLARELAAAGTQVDVVMGAPTSERLVCRDRLTISAQGSGGSVQVATDDGSEGVHGFCTAISSPAIESGAYDYVAICGPGPMEKNAAAPAVAAGVPCEVSLEKLMACGIGVCLACIVETTSGRKRCCADGPVFNAAEVIW